jgi:hypothetical protein
MQPGTVIALLLASALYLHAAPRLWSSADGQNAIPGDFLKRDATSITIRQTDGKVVTFPLAKLHPADRTWVNANHPLPGTAPPVSPTTPVAPTAPTALPNKAAVFDQLVVGDTRAQVLAKLKASKFVELTVPETFLGRTGLNGVFRTRKKIGGLDAFLFFDWTDEGNLKELTLQTETLPASAYQTKIEPSWKEFITLLDTLYGKPVQQNSLPRIESLTNGAFSPSHLWTLEAGGSALLGTARDDEKYQLVVRFTQKKIQPVALP